MGANKITLNGNLLIDLTQDTAKESDVAYGKTFHKSNGDIGIGTVVTQGLNVNGAVVEHTVANGTTVKAGDFVELINSGSALNVNAYSFGDVVYISQNKVLLICFGSDNVVRFKIFYYENGEWKNATETTCLVSAIPSSLTSIMINDNQGMLSWHGNSNINNMWKLYNGWISFSVDHTSNIVSVLHSEEMAKESVTSTGVPSTDVSSSLKRLDNTHFVTRRKNSVSQHHLESYKLNEDGTWVRLFTTGSNTLNSSMIEVIGSEKILWAKKRTSESPIETTVFDINNYVLIETETTHSFDNLIVANWGLIKVSDTKFALSSPNSAGGLISFIFENNEFKVVSEKINYPFNTAFSINNNICGYTNLKLSMVDFNTLEVISDIPLPYTSIKYSVAISSSSSFYLWQYTKQALINILVENNELVIDQGTPNRVQPCKSRNHIYGVALESGESNEVVKVNIPNNEV